MAERRQDMITKDLISKLADRGEDVVGKLSDFPAAQRLVEAAGGLRERVDEIQRRLRGLDALERRVAELEKKVDRLSGPPKRAAAKKPAAKKPAAKKPPKP
jgi:outer membrane murein-binding lipoprotein Lpp